MIEVLEILPGGRAIVSTKDLRRVRLRSDGSVLRDMLEPSEARAYARGYNIACGHADAKVEAYDNSGDSLRIARTA